MQRVRSRAGGSAGGPLAYVRNGDRIRLSVSRRELALLVADEDLQKRATETPIERPTAERGYRKLFLQTVTQADEGVDFDFLRAASLQTDKVPKPD